MQFKISQYQDLYNEAISQIKGKKFEDALENLRLLIMLLNEPCEIKEKKENITFVQRLIDALSKSNPAESIQLLLSHQEQENKFVKPTKKRDVKSLKKEDKKPFKEEDKESNKKEDKKSFKEEATESFKKEIEQLEITANLLYESDNYIDSAQAYQKVMNKTVDKAEFLPNYVDACWSQGACFESMAALYKHTDPIIAIYFIDQTLPAIKKALIAYRQIEKDRDENIQECVDKIKFLNDLKRGLAKVEKTPTTITIKMQKHLTIESRSPKLLDQPRTAVPRNAEYDELGEIALALASLEMPSQKPPLLPSFQGSISRTLEIIPEEALAITLNSENPRNR
ncbi:MAG: hypothetical protein ACHQJ6_03450 [Candidatus Berkiellales bacterium]